MLKNKLEVLFGILFLLTLSLGFNSVAAHELHASIEHHKATKIDADHFDKIFHLKLFQGEVKNNQKILKVTQGDVICLLWESDETTTLHLHGYDIAFNVAPGHTTELSLKATATGRFSLSNHNINLNKGHQHHALLYLEVYPE